MAQAQDRWEYRVIMKDIKSEFEEMQKAINALPEPLRSQKQKQLEAFMRKYFPRVKIEKIPPDESGWTKKDWAELLGVLKSRDRKEIIRVLEKHNNCEFGTPLMLDITQILEIDIKDLIKEYGVFIPVDEVLKRAKLVSKGK